MLIENVINTDHPFDVKISKLNNDFYKISISFDTLTNNSSFVFLFKNELNCIPNTKTNIIISKKDHTKKNQITFDYLNKLLLLNILDHYINHENNGINKSFMVYTELGILTIEFIDKRILLMINYSQNNKEQYTALYPTEHESKILHQKLIEELDLI